LLEKLGEKKQNLTEMLDTEAKVSFSTLLASQNKSYEEDRSSIDVHFAANREISASLFVTKIENATDERVRAVVYLIDNSEKKSLEQKFVQSQKMQAVGQLAGGIAHDFNNLLTAMIGFCDLLLMRYSPGDQSFADVMQIKQNANRAANLVRQLLAFSRKQTLQPEVVDIAEILAEISNLIRRLIGENIALKMRHGRDLSAVKVDQGQLEQVIVNLCVNARDAMDGKGELEILTRNEVINTDHPLPDNMISSSESEDIADGDYMVVEVRDNGEGMSLEVQSKIFEPFFTTKEVGKGTGLGLATVYGIIEQTGGHVFVSSVEGKGTSFYLYFKKHKEGKKVIKPVVVQEVQDLTGKGTVLVVEDEAPVRMFSCRALQNKGYEVLEAEDGDAGLLLAKEHGDKIDLIVTDVMMPGITGPEMIEEILNTHPNMKVVFMSGYGEDAFVTSYGAEREFFFLPKPFTLNQLAAKVKEVLGE
jgi:two-component system cell cycle sensor histidine kinase/response regulator CckA